MNAILNRLRKLSDDELLCVSEAIDVELEQRLQRESEDIPDSARRRAVQRGKSYRHSVGSSALPIRVSGLKDSKRRYAA
jgi:hypothetical protein